jgi:hypothetical protein
MVSQLDHHARQCSRPDNQIAGSPLSSLERDPVGVRNVIEAAPFVRSIGGDLFPRPSSFAIPKIAPMRSDQSAISNQQSSIP